MGKIINVLVYDGYTFLLYMTDLQHLPTDLLFYNLTKKEH